MNDINAPALVTIILILVGIFLVFWFLIQGVDKLATWLDEREEAKKHKIKRKQPLHLKKYLTVKNYLITLATLATIGIIVIAIKLL